MRLVQVLIPEGARELLLEALDAESVELLEVTVDYDPVDLVLDDEPQVNVLVGIPREVDAPPDLAQQLDDHVTRELGRTVVVRVGFVEEQVSDTEPSTAPADTRQVLPSHSRALPRFCRRCT